MKALLLIATLLTAAAHAGISEPKSDRNSVQARLYQILRKAHTISNSAPGGSPIVQVSESEYQVSSQAGVLACRETTRRLSTKLFACTISGTISKPSSSQTSAQAILFYALESVASTGNTETILMESTDSKTGNISKYSLEDADRIFTCSQRFNSHQNKSFYSCVVTKHSD